MAKWKYTTLEVSGMNRDTIAEAERELNELGKDGWEAVAWIPGPDPSKAFGRLLLKNQA